MQGSVNRTRDEHPQSSVELAQRVKEVVNKEEAQIELDATFWVLLICSLFSGAAAGVQHPVQRPCGPCRLPLRPGTSLNPL